MGSLLIQGLTLLLAAAAPVTPALADTVDRAATVSGRITSDDGHPIVGVRVEVVEVSRSTVSGNDGRYQLVNLPSGTYSVTFNRAGFRPEVRRVSVGTVDVELDIILKPSVVEIAPIQVTASPVATTALTSPQPIGVISGEDLRLAQRASLGATLETQAGVRSLSTGSGIGKPVIRGMTSNRVLILADGQRLESQQWGDEHGPNVETGDAARIEVIRGPASVLYGSDALGGVVNVVPRALPDAIGRAPFWRGSLSAAYGANNREPDGNLSLEGASGGFGIRGSLSGRTSGDIRTPRGRLNNSGNEAVGGEVTAGYRAGWGAITATYAGRDERLEIHENPAEEPDFSGFQNVRSDRAKVSVSLPVSGSTRLEVDGGFERNKREEIEEVGSSEVELGLLARTWTGDVHLHHVLGERIGGVVGVQFLRTEFAKFGEETLVPESDVDNFGFYAFEQGEFGRWNLSAGLRFDTRTLDVADDDDLDIAARSLDWTSVTGNLGVLRHLTERTALVLNLGRGFRAPSTFDLFTNGVHEGTVRFERGDPGLGTETSYNADLAFRVQSDRVSAEIGGFLNRVNGFIYPRPTAEFDDESGFRVFDITQGDARFFGFEAALEWHLSDLVHFRSSADYTNAQNLDIDQPLPFIPPFRVSYNLRLEPEVGGLDAAYFTVGGESNARQTRTDELDFAPAGYTLFNLGGGIAVPFSGRKLNLDLSIRNLFDKSYTNFMSRYKEFALDMGRNVSLRTSIGF